MRSEETAHKDILREPLVSVVITNYNRRDDLRKALESVSQQAYPYVEVIVVDNASQDGSVEMLSKEFPSVISLPLQENFGMGGYSVGFRHAKGEIVFQMDNDSLLPDPGVLKGVVQRFENGPDDLAVVAARVEEYDERHDTVNALRLRDIAIGPINTGGFHAGGVGFRKEPLDKVGYYNRDVFLYGSESFLLMKFLADGYRIFYYPELLVLHKSSPVARSSKGIYYEIRNRYWFLRCFACLRKQVHHMPSMLLNDFVYAISKRALGTFFKAVSDGFGSLPGSLSPLSSSNPQFVAKLDEFCAGFGLRPLAAKIVRAAKGRKR